MCPLEVELTLSPISDPALLITIASEVVTVVSIVVVVPLTVRFPATERSALAVTLPVTPSVPAT